RMPFLMAT
ncbi:A/G-specific adenine glycosylase, partial [Vibrio parahaemolyticus V-223/04]